MYLMKAVFTLNPDLSIPQITLLKAAIAVLILGASFNVNLKYIMVDSVQADCVGSLVFKTMQGSLGVIMSYYAINAFTVSTVGIAGSLSPLLVCILAAIILGEKVKATEIIGLIFVITGVCLIIGFSQGDD